MKSEQKFHDRFLNYVKTHHLFHNKHKLILAFSAGVDSVVLFHLLGQNGHNISCHSVKFDTEEEAKNSGESIQMLARSLRYEWFEKLRAGHAYDFILTAHHQTDNVETILYNFSKGASISGLRGIKPKNGSIIRPLLPFSKAEILAFAKEQNLQYREDASNASKKYRRNQLRHDVLPILHEINPSLEKTVFEHTNYLRDVESIYQYGVDKLLKGLIESRGEEKFISIQKLKKVPGFQTVLNAFLNPYNFHKDQVAQISESLGGQSGKTFYSESHQLIKDRKFLILADKNLESKSYHMIGIQQDILEAEIGVFHFKKVIRKEPFTSDSLNSIIPTSQNEVILQYNKVQFPLVLRHWKKGDYFYPFGMKKKKKKLSDFFIDQKLSLIEKEKVWILTDVKDRIIWLVGHRTDERFRVHNKTKQFLSIILKSE